MTPGRARRLGLPVLEQSLPWRGARLLGGFVAARPIHAIIQVSNRCNLTCSFCSFWANPARPEHELTIADLQGISAKLAEAGSLVISIEGGEPLLRPDVVEIVAAFARHHHPILFTNGWRVTPELARQLWDAGLDTIGISIDYPDAERHDRHRGKAGTFEAACRAIDVLRDSAPKGPRQVFVMSVLMRDNLDDFEALLQLSQRHRVGHQTTLVSTGGTMRQDSRATVPDMGAGARLLALKARYPHFISFSGYLAGIDTFLAGGVRTPCHAGARFLNIDHLGDVSPCIEKLGWSAGNLVREPYAVVAARLAAMEQIKRCTDCWTSCRGFVEEMSGMPKLRSWREFFSDFSKGRAP